MLRWAYPAAVAAAAALAAWWLSRRSYRVEDDTVYRTLPAWLLPVLAAVGALLAAPFYAGRPLVVIVTYGAALVWALVLAFLDVDVRRLPDLLTLPAYPAGALLLTACSAVVGDWTALLRAAACAGLATAVYLLAALISPGGEGLGLGDVKLAGVLGGLLGWLGWYTALYGVLAGFLVGGLLAGFLIVGRRADRKSYVSFGPAMIAGAYVCAVLLPPL